MAPAPSCATATPPGLWTYLARIRRVVDGDTLLAAVDLGLGHRALPRLRLRGLDAAELYTRRGAAARAFVAQALSRVDVVAITTWLTEAYGRYLADLKYLPGEPDPEAVLAEGTYLNRQLLQQGLAQPYLG